MPRKSQCPDCKTELISIQVVYDEDSWNAGGLVRRGYCPRCEDHKTDIGRRE